MKTFSLAKLWFLGDLDSLIAHALNALDASLSSDHSLTLQNTSLSIVGKDFPFKIFTEEELSPHFEEWKKSRPKKPHHADTPDADREMESLGSSNSQSTDLSVFCNVNPTMDIDDNNSPSGWSTKCIFCLNKVYILYGMCIYKIDSSPMPVPSTVPKAIVLWQDFLILHLPRWWGTQKLSLNLKGNSRVNRPGWLETVASKVDCS